MKRKKALPGRNVVVFSTLVGVLSLTSVILLLLAPAPLMPGVGERLFAVDTQEEQGPIFQTQVPLANWQYVYIHQSAGELISSNTDHFVIGGGNDLEDGELRIGQRWIEQTPAAPPSGARGVSPHCITICIAGDFNRAAPTSLQLRCLAELTAALRNRFGIHSDHILFVEHVRSAAGIGRYFPMAKFREELDR